MAETAFLKALTEVPSVGTACQPVLNLVAARLGAGYARLWHSDGFCLFQKREGTPKDLKVLFVTHLDEVGGVVYGRRADGGYLTRWWGNTPDIFANASLQAFDYLAESGAEAFPVTSEVADVDGEPRLILHGDAIRPYRTVFTFQQETTFIEDTISGKALDPRVTAYSVLSAALALDNPHVGVLCVMAEECAMEVVRKAVCYLQANAPNLELIVNADVPGIQNIGEGRLEMPAIRIFEGRNFIDPMFGIRVSEVMEARGVEFHLSAARSGSQTIYMTPLAPTLSVALPSRGVHLPLVDMSLQGTDRCTELLRVLGETALAGKLPLSRQAL